MTLSDLIIEHGPYVAGGPLPAWMRLRNMTTEDLNELREELLAARKADQVRERLTAALDNLVDPDPCGDYDHRGDCQAHMTTYGGKCAHATAKELLAELNRRAGEHAEVCR